MTGIGALTVVYLTAVLALAVVLLWPIFFEPDVPPTCFVTRARYPGQVLRLMPVQQVTCLRCGYPEIEYTPESSVAFCACRLTRYDYTGR